MKWRLLKFIENLEENNEMEHLGGAISFIQLPITYMELHICNCEYGVNNEIGQWNYIENH